jgi:hypothetical protein
MGGLPAWAIGPATAVTFLTHMAHERNCLMNGTGLPHILDRVQKSTVMRAEDRFYRGLNPSTWTVFTSSLTRDHFVRLYGKPRHGEVILSHAARPSCDKQRVIGRAAQAHRQGLCGHLRGILAGMRAWKGYRRILDGLQAEHNVFLLAAGGTTSGSTFRTGGRGTIARVIVDTNTCLRGDRGAAIAQRVRAVQVRRDGGCDVQRAADRPARGRRNAALGRGRRGVGVDAARARRARALDGPRRKHARSGAGVPVARSAETHARELVTTLTKQSALVTQHVQERLGAIA